MNNKIFVTIAVAVFLPAIFFWFLFFYLAPGQASVCFKDFCFKVEIAKTSAELSMGLMFRKALDQDMGMLFIFDKEALYPFWMKNTLIPLDMIWINSNNKVIFIAENVQPCKNLICPEINPGVAAKYVFEINAGISRKMGMKIGDEVVLSGY